MTVQEAIQEAIKMQRETSDIAQGPLLVHVLGGAAHRLRDAHKVHITMTEVE